MERSVVFLLSSILVIFACKAPKGYECVKHLNSKPTDYAIFDDSLPIEISWADQVKSCEPSHDKSKKISANEDKTLVCVCVKADQLFTTQFSDFCFPYTPLCANAPMKSDMTKGGKQEWHYTRRVYADVYMEKKTSLDPWKLFKTGLAYYEFASDGLFDARFLGLSMTPITTHGYMKGGKEKKTIVRMHQPKTGCDKKLIVTNLIEAKTEPFLINRPH
ncbi:hypothetical protein L596_013765 [Steinernema carpocapsae]|uniref:Uncharacterized protein n=1 Tax=Steinernema carpocapsae TaxID=34508 RepID=A0A4U5P1X6_STECR|nr:hypothetical protein L596_013765 [Steinernema carpocapsae]